MSKNQDHCPNDKDSSEAFEVDGLEIEKVKKAEAKKKNTLRLLPFKITKQQM